MCAALGALAVLAGHAPPAQGQAPATASLLIGYVAPAGDSTAVVEYRRGVDIGIREAIRAGELLSRGVDLVALSTGTTLGAAARELGARGVHALIVPVTDARDPAALGDWASSARVPVVAIGELAGMRCSPFVFRIAPPRLDATALLARVPAGDAATPGALPTSSIEVAFWHPSLERFGAAQLSGRFQAQYNTAMTSNAWAGWMAVKIIWESSLRSSPAPDALRHAISRSGFDGHKGRALRFGPDNILRQPLLIVKRSVTPGTPGDLVAEVAWPESAMTDSPGAGPVARGAAATTESSAVGSAVPGGTCAGMP